MASKYSQKFPIPQGFSDILHDFTREILRDQPDDIIEYSTLYFEALRDNKPFHYESKYNVKPEKPQGSHYNPKEKVEFDPQNPPKKAKKSNDFTVEPEKHLEKEEPILEKEESQRGQEESYREQEESQKGQESQRDHEEPVRDRDESQRDQEEPAKDQIESQREHEDSHREKEESQKGQESQRDQEEPFRDQEDSQIEKEEARLDKEDSNKEDSKIEREPYVNVSNERSVSRGTSHKEEKSIAREYIQDLNEEILDQALVNDNEKSQEKSQDLSPN